jgi:hypothetical protein
LVIFVPHQIFIAVDKEDKSRFESVYTSKVKAGKRRTYFFDVKRTKGDDYYITLTESTKRQDDSYERHKIFLYKEDFNRFLSQLHETIDHVKNNLMPDFDYEQFERRQAEWEASLENQENKDASGNNDGMDW